MFAACHAQKVRHSDEIGQRAGVHFPHDVAAVHLHRGLADTHLAGNLFVEEPRSHEPDDIFLAPSQCCEISFQACYILSPLAPLTVAGER